MSRKSSSLITLVKEEFIYILSAINKHNQLFIISAHDTREAALEAQKLFLETWANVSYWKNPKNGDIETLIETKPVKKNDI